MAAWKDVERDHPEFAAHVRSLFDARKHKTIATLRADGSPRISGIETQFWGGELVLGMMPGSVKAADLQRDPRAAIHVTAEDPPEDAPSDWPGDAKVAGRAIRINGPPGTHPPADWLRLDLTEVVLTKVGVPADHLLIEAWHDGRGLQRIERR